jgi:putative flippase GtrA
MLPIGLLPADPQARAAFWQFLRYGVIGGLITAGGQAIYYFGVEWFGIDPNISIGIAFVIGVAVGYFAHGWISFAGHGAREDHGKMGTRFIAVNLFGFAMNSLFVWFFVKYLHGPTWWPIVPNIALTPLATFWMHRKWTYGS